MRTLIFSLAIALGFTACITEDAEEGTDAAANADAAVNVDGGNAPDASRDASLDPDASQGCASENPAIPVISGCRSEADCPDGGRCVEDPLAGCVPSMCECDPVSGNWACTEDCRPVFMCEAAGACQGADPSAEVCIDDADCGVDAACVPNPNICRPSSCVCDPVSGGWQCTDDCGPANRCAPRSACTGPNPADGQCASDNDCAGGDRCVLDPNACVPSACACDEGGDWVCTADCGIGGQCQPQGQACTDDFECYDGFCEEGSCRQVCFGDGLPAACDALPPICAIGETSVTQGGCYACVDARTCGAPAVDPCSGAWLDQAGQCRAPNDGAYPAECCAPGAQARTNGLAKPDCAPHDGPATRLLLNNDVSSCDDEPEVHIEVFFWGELPAAPTIVDLNGPGLNGYIQYCPSANVCMSPAAARLMWIPSEAQDFAGRIELTLENGAVVRTTFATFDCPRDGEGFCG